MSARRSSSWGRRVRPSVVASKGRSRSSECPATGSTSSRPGPVKRAATGNASGGAPAGRVKETLSEPEPDSRQIPSSSGGTRGKAKLGSRAWSGLSTLRNVTSSAVAWSGHWVRRISRPRSWTSSGRRTCAFVTSTPSRRHIPTAGATDWLSSPSAAGGRKLQSRSSLMTRSGSGISASCRVSSAMPPGSCTAAIWAVSPATCCRRRSSPEPAGRSARATSARRRAACR